MEMMRSVYGEAAKRLGIPEEALDELSVMNTVYTSPLWSCYPVLPGEKFIYTGIWSKDKGAVTNVAATYILEEGRRICAVPLALVDRVEDDPQDRKKAILTLTGGETLSAPRVGRGIYKSVKRVLEDRGTGLPIRHRPELEAALIKEARAALETLLSPDALLRA